MTHVCGDLCSPFFYRDAEGETKLSVRHGRSVPVVPVHFMKPGETMEIEMPKCGFVNTVKIPEVVRRT